MENPPKNNNRIIEKISVDNNLSYDLSKLILNRNYSLDEITELENEFQINNCLNLSNS